MNKFSSMEFYGEKSEKCSTCGMTNGEANGCCHDDTKVIKLQDDHFASYHLFKLQRITPLITDTPVLAFLNNYNPGRSIPHIEHLPPDDKHPVYLVNKVFRI